MARGTIDRFSTVGEGWREEARLCVFPRLCVFVCCVVGRVFASIQWSCVCVSMRSCARVHVYSTGVRSCARVCVQYWCSFVCACARVRVCALPCSQHALYIKYGTVVLCAVARRLATVQYGMFACSLSPRVCACVRGCSVCQYVRSRPICVVMAAISHDPTFS